MPSAAPQIDSHVQVVTPENISFEYRVAGPFGRLLAYLIDWAIIIGVMTLAGIAAMLIAAAFSVMGWGGLGVAFYLVASFLLSWFYGGVFEAFWNGQTPGKKMLGLRVLRVDGRPISALQAVLRNFLRLVDLMAAGGLVGLFLMSLTKRYQRIGDLAVGTMVVVEDRSRFGKVPAPDEPGLTALLEEIPANFLPSRSLSKSLSHYVGRRRYFGPARRKEIAKHVGEVLVPQLNLPPDTNHDLLLCALYLRAFHEGEAASSDDKIAPRVPIPSEPPKPPQPPQPPAMAPSV